MSDIFNDLRAACGSCGAVAEIGSQHAYMHHLSPGVVLRCNRCQQVPALAAVLDRPWADVVLSGAVTTEQFRSNVTALNIVLDDDLRVRLRDLAEPPEQYWSERARLAWA